MFKTINNNLKNVLINGNCEIWNEGTNRVVTPGGGTQIYGPEMWYVANYFATGQATISQQPAIVPIGSNTRSNYSTKINIDTALTYSSGQSFYLSTRVEGTYAKILYNDNATLVFNHITNVPGTYTALISGPASYFFANFTVLAGEVGMITRRVIPVNFNNAVENMTKINSAAFALNIILGGHSSLYGSVAKNTWLPIQPYVITNDSITNFTSTAGNYMQIGDAALYPGKIDPSNIFYVPFMGVDENYDAQKSKRYWSKSSAYNYGRAYSTSYSANYCNVVNGRFPETMRISPNITVSDYLSVSGGVSLYGTNSRYTINTINEYSPTEFLGFVLNSGLAVGSDYWFGWTASARM